MRKRFSSLLNTVECNGQLEGVKVCRDAPNINHLLFAYDSLILLKMNEESLHHLQDILSHYEVYSGQTINVDKSPIMFSKNAMQCELI